ncbi:MAG: 6-carboxytetrahydropterin synthase [Flavobacteriales bacterium]|nr:6-carboxytetrahydropterin synthase [Flavobacteriales bacterium]
MSSEALPARVRVSKRFFFELAHALSGHDGTCAGVHGHSYVLDVTRSLSSRDRPSQGWHGDGLCDLKRIVQEVVIDRYDPHCYCMSVRRVKANFFLFTGSNPKISMFIFSTLAMRWATSRFIRSRIRWSNTRNSSAKNRRKW